MNYLFVYNNDICFSSTNYTQVIQNATLDIVNLKNLLEKQPVIIDCKNKDFLYTLQDNVKYTNLYEEKNIIIFNGQTLQKKEIKYIQKLLSVDSINYYLFSINMINYQIARLCKTIFITKAPENENIKTVSDELNINQLHSIKYLKSKNKNDFAAYIWSLTDNITAQQDIEAIGKFLDQSLQKVNISKPSAIPQIIFLWEHWNRFYTMTQQELLSPNHALKAFFNILNEYFF